MRKFKFYKESDSRWYVDLPEWLGSKSDLEMVCGADKMLDILSEGKDYVYLYLSTKEFTHSNILELVEICKPEMGGGWYILKEYNGVKFDLYMWLCDVTKFVFGELPSTIYIAVINE